MNNGNKEPYRECILKVLKEEHKDNKGCFLSAREIQDRLLELDIELAIAPMYRALDRLSMFGYIEVKYEINAKEHRSRRVFRYIPY